MHKYHSGSTQIMFQAFFMAKPICVIYIDKEVIDIPGQTTWEAVDSIREGYASHLPDYHVFVIPDFTRDEPIPVVRFHVFYEKDFTQVQHDELKSIIEVQLKLLLPE